jgi:hypothetical protein
MLKKGFKKIESPEKMPVETTGIEMEHGTRKDQAPEKLTGGNAAADEAHVARLVSEYMTRY